MSESAKVRDLPDVMAYIKGEILDVGCGPDKITPQAVGIDGRQLPGVDIACEMDFKETIWECIRVFRKDNHFLSVFDTIYSSHYLEHTPDPYDTILGWGSMLKLGGHLVLYLPDKDHYNNYENKEHLFNWGYKDFMFWFTRVFCGEGKDYRGDHRLKMFDIVTAGTHYGDDLYSFYLVAKKV